MRLVRLGLGLRLPSGDFYFYGAIFSEQVTSLFVRRAKPFLCDERCNLRIGGVWNFNLKPALMGNAVWQAV